MDYNFTANLENQLDEVNSGKTDYIRVLEDFWKDFYSNVGSVKDGRTREVLDMLNESLGDLVFDKDKNDQIDEVGSLQEWHSKFKNSFRVEHLQNTQTILSVNLQDLYLNQKHHK